MPIRFPGRAHGFRRAASFLIFIGAAVFALLSPGLNGQQAGPYSLWTTSTTPGPVAADPSAVELGMKFRADSAGTITGMRFYKYAQNTGTHVGNLWSSSGALLGSVTFGSETASGWQTATFTTPIAITANTVYVVSYHTTTGYYAATNLGFATGVDVAPLHALADGVQGGNGVYLYGSASGFPTQSYQSTNYWVDVVFSPGDTTAPVVSVTSPAAGATVSGAALAVTATASDNIGVAGVQFKLDGANLGAEVTTAPYTTTWNTTTATNGSHTLTAVARDAAGNSTTSAGVTVTVSNTDATAPSVSITAPAAGATVSGAAVAVTASASDNVGVAGVQFKLDGANLGAEDTASPYTMSWNTTTATNASHTLTAVARDAAGNTTTSTAVVVTVNNTDSTAPTVSIAAPAAGSTVSGAVAVTASASDNVGVAGVQFKLDGTNLGAEVTTSPYTTTWNTAGAANGSHTLTAVARDAAGNTTTSAAVSVTVSNAASGALTLDATAFGDRNGAATNVVTGAFSTTATNEVLLAFVSAAADAASTNTTVSSVTGGGLTWQLVLRTNVQRGTAEVWRALAANVLTNVTVTAAYTQNVSSSITVVSIKGADLTGTNGSGAIGATVSANANPGAPTGTVTTTRAGSLVFGVGNDWDGATARTLGSNQTMVHQLLATTTGDTYWVQRTSSGSAAAGTAVTLNDTAPTTDRYNLSLVEVVPAQAADSTPPTVTMTAPAAGATVSGTAVAVSATATDNISVAGVQFKLDGANIGAEDTASPYTATWNTTTAANGTHTLTAVARDAAGNTASATSITVTVANDVTPPTVTMTAPAAGASVSGAAVVVSATASDNAGVAGVQFKIDGANLGVEILTAPYTVTWDTRTVGNGTHTLSAVARDAAGNTATATAVSVTTANDLTPPTVTTVTPTSGTTNVSIGTTVAASFSEAIDPATVTSSTVIVQTGATTVTGTVAANGSTATFTPSAPLALSSVYTVTVKGGASGVKDLSGNALASDYVWTFATLTCPCSIWSLTTTPGPVFNDAAAVELGVKFKSDLNGYITGLRFYKYAQNTGTHVASLWTSGGTLLATATYASETASGWQEVVFPTAVPVTANTTYVASYHTNAGYYAMTSGGFTAEVDSSPLHAIADGVSGGNGLFLYSANSAFPTQSFSASNYWVDAVFTTQLVDATAPTVTMTAPTAGATVTGSAVSVTATANDNVGVAGVQFTLDGASLGAEVTTAPYTVTWNSTTAANGTHSLSAVARDAAGNQAAATAVSVTVSNVDSTAPTVTMTAPLTGAVVSGSAVTVSASATDNIGVAGVQFLLDNVAVGTEVTSAPYTLAWNTLTVASGTHTLAARARDAAGNQTTSAAVTISVMNTSTLSIDVTAFGDRSTFGTTITTSAFSTTGTNELLLAFVGAAASTSGTNVSASSVTGGGLTWQLVARTNTQRGTAEVWRAFAAAALTNVTVTATITQSQPASITVVAFKGVETSGTNGSGAIGATLSANAASGAPTATLTTTRPNSWVFGTGNDWDAATARTVGANQTMVHQYLASTGDTYWTQRTNAVTANSGTAVTINDTAPTADRYNLTLVEILPSLGSGADTTPPTITSTSPVSGATGASAATIVTANFSEPVDATTVNGTTVTLRDASNALVAATVLYDSANRAAVLSPSAALAAGTSYTATVSGVKDVAGNSMASAQAWSFTTAPASSSLTSGPGGPILVVSNTSNPFTTYYAEILRAEGLNAFSVADLTTVTATKLASYDVVILGEQTLTTTQVNMFTTWVQGGGNLIAMRPDKKLATLLGLTAQSTTLTNGYLAIDTTQPAGTGLVSQTIQFHGTADHYIASPATTIATLYSTATQAMAYPAVTLNTSGSGRAAAFTYDLAKSIVYTRQGNPAWAGQDRDGTSPIRSNDLFFGAKAGDVQSDWIDLNKVSIPQADEQQRLLANLIIQMNSSRKPLPRFWYLPRGLKAAVVLTGDDHARGGTPGRFDTYLSQSPAGCNVDNWECVRGTSYVYTNEPMTNAQVAGYVSQGFEVALHVSLAPGDTTAGCGTPSDFTSASLPSYYSSQLAQFASIFPAAGAPKSNRMHCLVWSDWFSQPTVEAQNGIRLDTSYYYWPGTWVLDRPGMFTGSGMPMRFASTTGTMADVYQATTQMTDESGQTYPNVINVLLDNATGSLGYYGVFTANMHTDSAYSAGSDYIVSAAKARNVPLITARQLLTWLDGRNGSAFGAMTWSANTLTFSVAPGTGANGLQMLVPTKAGALNLSAITLNGVAASYTTQTIKGISYAVLTVAPGQYKAVYQ